MQTRPIPSWSEAREYQTTHYNVRTNAGQKVGYEIGLLMEKAFTAYAELLGLKSVSLPRLLINAYVDRDQYEKVARRLGFPSYVTSGHYSPVPPAAIYLPYTDKERQRPEGTLLHEGMHQFADRILRFTIPQSAKKVYPPPSHKLVCLPLWLNEGLAVYMESAVDIQGRLQVGLVNQDRLIDLKKWIMRRNRPGLTKALSLSYGEPIGAEDYAVFWGLVYSLRHAPDYADQEEGRRKLSQYIKLCLKAFYQTPETEFLNDFVPGGREAPNFQFRWAKYIGRRSLEAFKEIIVGEGTTLHAWEQDWVNRIIRLTR